jgi:thiol-disulfide isomerase/thioredoxin
MIRCYVLAFMLLVGSFMPATTIAGALEPEVYVFGAENCGYCDRAVKFLRRLYAEKGRFNLHEYDVVSSSNDATLFVKVVTAIGLNDPVVPMVIVGREVLLGFESDETSGREIQRNIEQCHVAGCPDLLRPLIVPTEPAGAAAMASWVIHRQWAVAALRR